MIQRRQTYLKTFESFGGLVPKLEDWEAFHQMIFYFSQKTVLSPHPDSLHNLFRSLYLFQHPYQGAPRYPIYPNQTHNTSRLQKIISEIETELEISYLYIYIHGIPSNILARSSQTPHHHYHLDERCSGLHGSVSVTDTADPRPAGRFAGATPA